MCDDRYANNGWELVSTLQRLLYITDKVSVHSDTKNHKVINADIYIKKINLFELVKHRFVYKLKMQKIALGFQCCLFIFFR